MKTQITIKENYMKSSRILIAAALAAATTSAFAADQADVRVTASVLNNCKIISTKDINFGALDPAAATDRSANGAVSFVCTKNVDYALSADQGANFDGASKRRQMKGGDKDFLPYALEKDTFAGKGSGFSTPLNITLTANVAGNDYKDLPAANYADLLRVTLTP